MVCKMTGRAAVLLISALVVHLCCGTVQAHHARLSGDAAGLPIPGLTHGQMKVMAAFRTEVLELAASQRQTDPTFRRLLNFANIQFTYCAWGLVPGSLDDEENPFNGCSHSYLAATKALLMHMQQMPDARSAAHDLATLVDLEMIKNASALSLCRFSSGSFSSSEIVHPEWMDLFRWRAAWIVLFMNAAAICAFLLTAKNLRRLLRRTPASPSYSASASKPSTSI